MVEEIVEQEIQQAASNRLDGMFDSDVTRKDHLDKEPSDSLLSRAWKGPRSITIEGREPVMFSRYYRDKLLELGNPSPMTDFSIINLEENPAIEELFSDKRNSNYYEAHEFEVLEEANLCQQNPPIPRHVEQLMILGGIGVAIGALGYFLSGE